MSDRIVTAYQQFLDDNGDPVANGTIEFFENFTTTPKTIFSDPAFTTPQTNPYTLDINGSVQADVFLDGVYTYELRSVDTALIRTINDVTGSGGGESGATYEDENQLGSDGASNNKLFTLSVITYLVGGSALFVYVNGVRQNITEDYVETSSTQVTFERSLEDEDDVKFEVLV